MTTEWCCFEPKNAIPKWRSSKQKRGASWCFNSSLKRHVNDDIMVLLWAQKCNSKMMFLRAKKGGFLVFQFIIETWCKWQQNGVASSQKILFQMTFLRAKRGGFLVFQFIIETWCKWQQNGVASSQKMQFQNDVPPSKEKGLLGASIHHWNVA